MRACESVLTEVAVALHTGRCRLRHTELLLRPLPQCQEGCAHCFMDPDGLEICQGCLPGWRFVEDDESPKNMDSFGGTCVRE